MNLKNNILFILLSFIFITNCKEEEFKVCINQSPDTRIKLYNELTDQLLMYNFFGEDYLGKRKKYFDSLRVFNDEKHYKESVKAHNQIYNNEKSKCVLYLDSMKIKNTDISTYNNESRKKMLIREKRIFKGFSNEIDVFKNLCKRSTVKANDFNLCTVVVLNIEEKHKNEKKCEAGIIYFSEIVFDKSKKNAIVFVNFRNKYRAGRNYIFKLTLVNNYWQLEDGILLAIS